MKHLENIDCITLPTPFAVGDVNIYLIHGDKLTLVDTGPKTEEAWQAFQQQLKGLGIKLIDIDQVVLTHHHPDHVGLADYLKGKEMPFIGLAYNEPWLRRDPVFFAHHDHFYHEVYQLMGVESFHEQAMRRIRGYLSYSCFIELDQILKEGDQINGLPGWSVLETPGHAQGHLSLFREADGVMVGGDLLIGHISSNALIEPPPIGVSERPKTLLQYRDSLRKIVAYNTKKVYAGHGDPIKNPKALVYERFSKQEERAQDILNLITNQPLNGYEICQRLFPSIYMKELGLTLSETLGHLDLLIDKDLLVVNKKEEVLYFQAKEAMM